MRAVTRNYEFRYYGLMTSILTPFLHTPKTLVHRIFSLGNQSMYAT